MKKIGIALLVLWIALLININLISGEDESYAVGQYLGFTGRGEAVHVIAEKTEAGQGVATVYEGGYIKYKYGEGFREYKNLKASEGNKGAIFKFKDKKLVEASFTVGSEEEKTKYRFGDLEYNLPKGTQVSLKDGKLEIKYPEGSELKKPEKVGDSKEKIEAEFSAIDPKKGLKLENGDIAKQYEEQPFRFFYNSDKEQFWSDEPMKINNLDIGTQDTQEFYLTTKWVIPADSDKAVILLDKSKNTFAIFAPAGKNSPSVEVLKGDYGGFTDMDNTNNKNILMVQATGVNDPKDKAFSEKSLIIVSPPGTPEDIPRISTKGSYEIVNGNRIIKYNPHSNGPRAYYFKGLVKTDDTGKKTVRDVSKSSVVPTRITSRDTNGELITYKGIKTDSHGNLLVGKDGKYIIEDKKLTEDIFTGDIVYKQTFKQGEKVVEKVIRDTVRLASGKEAEILSKAVFYSLTPEEKQKFILYMPKDEQLSLLGQPLSVIKEKIKNLQKVQIGKTLEFQEYKATKSGGGSRSKTLRDIQSHEAPDDSNSGDTLGHETTHGINSYLRRKYGKGGSEYDAFYLLNDQFVVLKEPNPLEISDIEKYIPGQMKTRGSYGTYVSANIPTKKATFYNRVGNSGDDPLYFFDELTAYTNGGLVALELGGGRTTPNIPDMMVYGLAAGLATKSDSRTQNYWRGVEGERLREFMAYSLERSMNVHVRLTGNRDYAVRTLNGMMNNDLRNFARDTYGSAWTQKVLGFR